MSLLGATQHCRREAVGCNKEENKHFLRIHYVTDPVLSTPYILSHLILIATRNGGVMILQMKKLRHREIE